MSDKKNKKKVKYQLPSEDGIDVMGLLNNISIILKKQIKNTPPDFSLEIGVPADNIRKQLKEQKIEFDPSVIKRYDKMIKSIINLKTEGMIGKKKSQELIHAIYERSIKHVYFIYEMIQEQIMEIEEKDVKVKMSICPECKNAVRVAIEHAMDKSRKKEFMKEVDKYNLDIKTISLIEYRESNIQLGCNDNCSKK